MKMKLTPFLFFCVVFMSDGAIGQQRLCGVFRCKGSTPSVDNGAFVVEDGKTHATLQCDPGYDVSGQKTISCAANLQWAASNGVCQGLSGTTFLTVFPYTLAQEENNLRRLLITSNGPTNVNITNGASTESVVVNDILFRDFPIDLTLSDNNVVNDKVVIISSDLPINVHTLILSLSASQQSEGSFLVLPVQNYYREYILITTERTPQFNVIAKEDNTEITVNLIDGGQFTRILNKNQVYTRFFFNSVDRTGTVISSDKDVAVLSGGRFARIPNSDRGSRDLNVAQLIGVEDWKQLCIMGPYKPRNGFEFKVVASQDNTVVNLFINGVSSTVTLNRRGRHVQLMPANTENTVVVQSDKPVLVAQFSLNNIEDPGPGFDADSSMVLCVPPDEWLDVYRFFVPAPNVKAFLRITIRSAFKDDLRLNDNPLTTFDNVSVMVPGGDSYDILFVEVTTNLPYKLETVSGEPFGADLYGNNDALGPTQFAYTLNRRTL